MPEYLAPGVYVEEISTGPKPIEGVSTSVAGFLGPTERGPEDVQYVTSWLAYQRWYGKLLPVEQSFMVHAIQGFFDNGGQRCFVGRITGQGSTPATRPASDLNISAIGRGAWGERVFVRIKKSSQAEKGVTKAAAWVRVQILYFSQKPPADPPIDPFDTTKLQDKDRRQPDVIEDFDNLSPDPKAANSLVTTINLSSKLVRVAYKSGANTSAITAEADFGKLGGGTDGAKLDQKAYLGSLEPIDPAGSDLLGQGTGLAGMDTVDEVSLLLAPDEVDSDLNLTDELVKRCELLRDRFAILSSPLNFNPADPIRGKPSSDTHYGAQYYPWIRVYDPEQRDEVLIPPVGHVAGILARTDLEYGVHKAPANAVVIGAKGLQKPVPKGVQDLLNPVGINCIRDFRSDGRGIRLWGARTMTSDPEWKYVNVRRLFLFIEESIDEGTQWVVFEPNAPETWARVVRTITAFLTTLWRNGALLGLNPGDAFFVKCDRTTMAQDDIDGGRMICLIGVAPVKPAEFVIFRIGQKTADAK